MPNFVCIDCTCITEWWASHYCIFLVAQHFMRQIVEGMFYLHSHGILHRDLTLANLLLTRNMNVVSVLLWILQIFVHLWKKNNCLSSKICTYKWKNKIQNTAVCGYLHTHVLKSLFNVTENSWFWIGHSAYCPRWETFYHVWYP